MACWKIPLEWRSFHRKITDLVGGLEHGKFNHPNFDESSNLFQRCRVQPPMIQWISMVHGFQPCLFSMAQVWKKRSAPSKSIASRFRSSLGMTQRSLMDCDFMGPWGENVKGIYGAIRFGMDIARKVAFLIGILEISCEYHGNVM